MLSVATLPDTVLSALQTPEMWLQLGLVAAAAALAWTTSHFWGRRLADVRREHTGIKRLTLATGQRLLFPFSMLLLVLGARAVLNVADHPTEVLDAAVPLLLSLAAIRFTVYVLRKAFNPSAALRAWENIIGTLVWAAVALHLLGWLPAVLKSLDSVAFTVGTTRVSLLWLSKLTVSVGFFLLLALWLSAVIEKRLLQSKTLSAGLRVGLAKTARLTIVTVGFLVALNATGFDLTGLAVFGGALGVGLGFGLQRITSNFISGFILLFDRSIRPGDVITIGNSFGWVQELRARYVVVRDRDGVDTLIPNENLITTQVINWSYSDLNVRVKIPVQISYKDDPEQAMALMLEAARASSRALTDPPPVCRLMQFGESGIDLELRVWISDPQEGLSNVRSDINVAIWRAFKRHGITIPFPQRDVHLRQTAGPPRD